MKMLIIGNGFDLAHNLKTRYENFLDNALAKSDFKLKTTNFYAAFTKSDNGYMFNAYDHDFYDINMYHLDNLFALKDNWIDIENNLASILDGISEDEKEFQILSELYNEFLLPEFEEYIATNINQSEVKPVFDCSIISDFDFVISFNYSNTLERLYTGVPPICYINGKAQKNATASNIVFGCDFFQRGDEYIKHSWFDKEYQRTYKETDGSFKTLYDTKHRQKSITIIGHSLGKTDHSIIKPFFDYGYSATTVYYHNDESKRWLIHRMKELGRQGFLDKGNIQFKNIKEILSSNEE